MRVTLALALLVALVGSAAEAQQRFRVEREQQDGPVEVRAERVSADQTGETVTATGTVEVTWEGHVLRGAKVAYDRKRSLIDAEGSVVLEDGDGNVLRCSRLTVNTDTQQGEVEDGTLWIAREGYRVWGKRFHKNGPDTYRVEDGGFTPCDGTWPSWRVNATRLEVQLEGYLVARSAAFWVEGLPVLYTPYVVFPVKRIRQSGFLIPKIGLSSRDGLILATRYYWAFSDSADVTARLEYRSKRGWIQGAELRYVLAEGHEGTAEASHIYDRQDDADRYTVAVDHSSKFDEVTRAKLHIDYAGDRKLVRDLGDTIDQRGVQRKENFLLGTRDHESGTAYGLFRYVQALQDSQAPVLQTLPQTGLAARETPLAGPVAVEPTLRFTNFSRTEGTEGQRLEFVPGLAWDSRIGGLGLGARAGYRENLYLVGGDAEARGAATVGVDASALFARRFGETFLHTIEPRLSWTWREAGRGIVPAEFDDADIFENGSFVNFLLESRFLRTWNLAPVAGLDVERSLDLGILRSGGSGEAAFGPWRAKGTVNLDEALQLRVEGDYDPSLHSPWLRWSAAGESTDSRKDRFSVGYHYLKGRAAYLDGALEVPIASNLSAQYRNRYSFRDERPLEQGVGIHLVHQCWEVLVTVSRNYLSEDKTYENRFFLTAQMKGLGKLGTMRGIVP